MGKLKIGSIGKVTARGLRSYFFLVPAGLIIIGLLTFNVFMSRPDVGIVRISNVSLEPQDVPKIVNMLQYAEETEAIKALVLEIDCVGGGTAPTEEVFFNILRLKSKKPVVAYVNLWSLSGGYHIAAAANYIYAKPSSLVGNVGVWASLPPEREDLTENVLGSGPFKTVTNRRDVINWIEMIKESFLRAVISQRGERLKISKEELSQARIYLGIEGLRYGLIDEMGSSSDAIKKAAALAGIKRYGLVDINKKLDLLPPWYEQVQASREATSLNPRVLKPPAEWLPMFYYSQGGR